MPQEVDTGKRRLLTGAATLVGAGVVIAALSPLEKAYAALDAAARFPDRRNRTSLTHSAPNDTPVTYDLSQGQPVNIQDTPTPDATVTEAQKEKAIQDAIAARNQNDWWRTNALGVITAVVGVGTLATAGGTIAWNVYQYRKNREAQQREQKSQEQIRNEEQKVDREKQQNIERIDRAKRDEDRFREAVLALGKDETQLGAATTLRTFLDEKNKESYKRFYQQIFDLSVGFLRFRKVDQNNPEPAPFYREIIRVFCESTPLVREMLREMLHLQTLSQSDVPNLENYQRKFINASHIHLENADLPLVDLSFANLTGANLVAAYLGGADLSEADLSEADLTRANPEEASTLQDTKMWNIKNYSDPEKLQKCKAKGAIIDPPPDQPKTKGETK